MYSSVSTKNSAYLDKAHVGRRARVVGVRPARDQVEAAVLALDALDLAAAVGLLVGDHRLDGHTPSPVYTMRSDSLVTRRP